MNIDYESLRDDLIDYFGAACPFYPIALIDIIKVEKASDEELVNIAINNGFNLSDYEIIVKSNKLNRDFE